MESSNSNPYHPQAYLAARRHDPERERLARVDAAAVSRFLAEKCGARVYGIGSLFDAARPFGVRSDIDLVVADLPKGTFFELCAQAQELTRFQLDIIPYEDANELVRETVRERGVLL